MKDRREFLKASVAGGLAIMWSPSSVRAVGAAPSDAWDQLPQILRRIKPPVFPKRDFDIAKYGAVEGGASDCTAAL